MSEAPPLDRWLAELGVEVVAAGDDAQGAAVSRDVVLDGHRRYDLRVTIAWVAGVGASLWGYYGLEAMEIPKRIYARMLRANFDYPFVKFAMTDDDRPMLMTELPTAGFDRDELGRGLVRLTVVADRLLEETAPAVADRGRPARLVRQDGPELPAAGGISRRGRVGHARVGASGSEARRGGACWRVCWAAADELPAARGAAAGRIGHDPGSPPARRCRPTRGRG